MIRLCVCVCDDFNECFVMMEREKGKKQKQKNPITKKITIIKLVSYNKSVRLL